jgi:hypothetical protein
MTELSLFPDDSIEARRQTIDADILWLLTGHPGGPQNLTLSLDEKQVLTAIRYCRGAANAVTIRDLQEFKGCETLDAREIKKRCSNPPHQLSHPYRLQQKGKRRRLFCHALR